MIRSLLLTFLWKICYPYRKTLLKNSVALQNEILQAVWPRGRGGFKGAGGHGPRLRTFGGP